MGSNHAILSVEANTEPFTTAPDDVGRLSTFTFSKAQIPIGSEIYFAPLGKGVTEISCRVIDDTHVEFEGESFSLTRLASKLLGRKAGSGPKYFVYEGERLYLRRRRVQKLGE